MISVFSKKLLAKYFQTFIKTINMLLGASPYDNFSHFYLTIWFSNAFTFLPTFGLLFHDEWMQLHLMCCFSACGLLVLYSLIKPFTLSGTLVALTISHYNEFLNIWKNCYRFTHASFHTVW